MKHFVQAGIIGALMIGGATAASGQAAEQPLGADGGLVGLDQALAVAMANGPDLQLATATLDAARQQYLAIRAQNGVSIGATGGYFFEDNLPGVSSASTESIEESAATATTSTTLIGQNVQGGLALTGPATNVSVSAESVFSGPGITTDTASLFDLQASQTLYDGYPGGRAQAAVQQAAYTYEAAQVAYEAAQKSVDYKVREEYYTLLGDQETVNVQVANLKQDNEDLSRTLGFFHAQEATSLDVLQARVAARQAELNVRTAENTVDVDRKTLSSTLGWPLDTVYQVAETPPPALPTIDAATALKTAYENRSELLTFDFNRQSAQVNLALQKSQYSPVVSLNADATLEQDWTVNLNEGSYDIGVSVSAPIWDGGLIDAQVKQASAQVVSLAVQEDQERQSISIAVENALFGIKDAKDRLDLAQQNVDQARGTYELYVAEFQVGLATNLDVLTYSAALTSAEVGLEQAKTTYILAVLTLKQVMGL